MSVPEARKIWHKFLSTVSSGALMVKTLEPEHYKQAAEWIAECSTPLRTLDALHLSVAASLGASPVRVLRSVIMPEAWPALMAGGSLVLLLTLNEFGIVLFTGAKGVMTLPVLIYTRGIVTFDLPGAAVIATVQIALSLALYVAYRMIFARVTAGKSGRG